MKAFRFAFAALLAPSLLGPALAAGGAGEAPPLPASRLEAAMTLYAGGITMGHMAIDASLRGGAYHTVSNMQTSGVVNAFWQAEIQATSSGKLGPKTVLPALYDSFDKGRGGRKQQVSLNYDGNGAPRLYADPAYATTGFEVKPDDTRNTLDPLSAVTFIFSGLGGTQGNPCAVIAPVFDGRRRYDIELTRIKDVDVAMDNGLYKGKAVQCDVRYHQLAGFRPRVLKENENFPLIHAWLVSLPSAVTRRDYAVPVRVWAETRYGVVAAVATAVTVDGETPKGFRP